jgi:antitoxin component YwqK of YwqJK toxin-antitoxin module
MDITALKHSCYFILIFSLLCGFSSCNYAGNVSSDDVIDKTALQAQNLDSGIDLSGVPNDTVNDSDPGYSIKNGLFYFKGKKFSGILKKYHAKVNMVAYTSVYQGKRHGPYSSYYDTGALFETKQYKHNRVTGRHYIYWKNGNLKADNWYYNGRMEGTQKKWYADGTPFYVFNYKNGKREGKQKAWRTSGKLQINNEIIHGKTYGLNRATLCYNVENEKPELLGYAEIREKKTRE